MRKRADLYGRKSREKFRLRRQRLRAGAVFGAYAHARFSRAGTAALRREGYARPERRARVRRRNASLCGVSGDCAVKISSYLPCPCPESGCTLRVDFLPDVSAAELQTALEKKLNRYAEIPAGELLGGILNNRAGMVIAARAQEKFAVKNGGKEKRGENFVENFAKRWRRKPKTLRRR